MGRRLRFVPQGCLVEVTARTIQGRFLLKPGPKWTETFVGILARARELYPVKIHGFVCLSNHLHLLLSPRDAQQLASFMAHFLSNLSKEAARRHGWRGPLFERRYQAIAVTDEEAAQVRCLHYLLAHGVKENLVEAVEDWPGPHCVKSLKTGEPVRGRWLSRARYWQARNHGKSVKPGDFSLVYELSLDPLPCWAHLRAETYKQRITEIVKAIDNDSNQKRSGERRRTLGVRTILAQSPLDRPVPLERRPAPLVHASSHREKHAFCARYVEFVTAFYEAVKRLRKNLPESRFPPGAFIPPRAFARPG